MVLPIKQGNLYFCSSCPKVEKRKKREKRRLKKEKEVHDEDNNLDRICLVNFQNIYLIFN